MAKTLKDLALALLNATLILVALCLFLAWKVADRAHEVAERIDSGFQLVTPLKAEMSEIKKNIQGLRNDLTTLSAAGPRPQNIEDVQAKLETLEQRMSTAQARLNSFAVNPGQLIDRAAISAADAFATRLRDLRGCVPKT